MIYLRPRPKSANGCCIGRAHSAHTALAVVCVCSFIKVPNYTEIWNISWQSRRKMATVIHNPLKSWVFLFSYIFIFPSQWNVTVHALLAGKSTGISARFQWIQYFPNQIYCDEYHCLLFCTCRRVAVIRNNLLLRENAVVHIWHEWIRALRRDTKLPLGTFCIRKRVWQKFARTGLCRWQTGQFAWAITDAANAVATEDFCVRLVRARSRNRH